MFGVAFTQLAVLVFISLGGPSSIPLGMPPGPEDPVMAQFAPEECLFYSTWSSTVTPDPSRNVTERWMAQPELVKSFDHLKLAMRQMSQSGEENEVAFDSVAYQLAARCLSCSVGFYLSEIEFHQWTPLIEGGALIDLGTNGQELMEKITQAMKLLADREKIKIDMVQYSGFDFWTIAADQTEMKSTLTWGFIRDQYLAITIGEGEMQRLLGNLRTAPPQWLTDLRNDLSVDRVSSVSRIDVDGCADRLLQFMEEEDPRSVDGMKRFFKIVGVSSLGEAGWVSGLDGDGFICRGAYRTQGEPEGLLGLIVGEPLEPNAFGKIVDQPMIMLGARVSAPKAFELLRDFSGLYDRSETQFDQGVAWISDTIGVNIQTDVLENLDDHAYLYGSVDPAQPMVGWVLGLGVLNEMALMESYHKLNEFMKATCRSVPGLDLIETEVAGRTFFTFSESQEFRSIPEISWSLSQGELLLSLDPETLSGHLQREWMTDDALVKNERVSWCFAPPRENVSGPLWVSSVNVPSLIEMAMPLLRASRDPLFPTELDFDSGDIPSIKILTRDMKPSLSAVYQTSGGFETIQRQTYPGGTPGAVVGATAIGLLPALMKVRNATARAEAVNQIRQLTIAMHNYHDAYDALPARFSKSDDGKPLLSWRVHILPFIEGGELYQEFHLDEPWDSEHNRTLIERMPDAFRHPKLEIDVGKTVYLVPATNGVMRAPEDSVDEKKFPTGMKLQGIIDGTSNTALMLIGNAENAVTWTQPDDFQWEALEDPVNGLYDGWGDGLHVGLADGSVYFVKGSWLRIVFGNLIQPDDGEVIPFERDN